MFVRNVPKIFWSDVIQTTAFLMNRMHSRVLSYKSPIEVLSPSTPLFSLPPKTFGCICYVHISKFDHTKLEPKALKCVLLGYGVDQKWYKCFHPLTRKKFVSRDVTFFQSIPFFSSDKTSLQGESLGEELSSSSTIPLLLPVPSFHFDNTSVK